jgi:hypothetical protein
MTSKYRGANRQFRSNSRRLTPGKVDMLHDDVARLCSELQVGNSPIQEAPIEEKPRGFGIGIEEIILCGLIYAGSAILSHVV